jgi:hypothetical protein
MFFPIVFRAPEDWMKALDVSVPILANDVV